MKTLIAAALLALAGCAPMTPDESARLSQVMFGISGAAVQQQADANAEFYRRQQYYQQVQQTQQIQQLNQNMQAVPVEQRGAGGWF